MISEKEKEAITACAAEYGVRRVLLFGSALSSDTDYDDIDIAVDGLPPKLFFRFYGELLRKLEKPVDLVDLSDHTPFTDYVSSQGVLLYG